MVSRNIVNNPLSLIQFLVFDSIDSILPFFSVCSTGGGDLGLDFLNHWACVDSQMSTNAENNSNFCFIKNCKVTHFPDFLNSLFYEYYENSINIATAFEPQKDFNP